MTVIDEISDLVGRLPRDKSEAVLQFVRFLSEQADDQAWERSFAAASSSQRFQHELADIDREMDEGKATPLSADDL